MSGTSTFGLRSNVKVTVLGECVICEEVTSLRCQACLKGGKDTEDIPFYCSRQHQIKHWKSGHKTSCGQLSNVSPGWKLENESPCTLSKNVPEGISYFVATEDLKPGRVLFQRKPLLAFPSLPSAQDSHEFLSKMPPFVRAKVSNSVERVVWTCVGCYETLLYGEIVQSPGRGLTVNRCLLCGWPLHSNVHPKHGPSRCQAVHEEECKIFVEKELTWEKLKEEKIYLDIEFYYHLGLLRALLLPQDRKEEFMKLPVFAPEYYHFEIKTIPFVRERCGFGDRVGEEEAKMIMHIIFGNILGPPNQHVFSKNKLAFIIYSGGPTGRIMSHDCTPNCAPYIGKDLTATFKIIRTVDQGQLLTINYIMSASLPGPVNGRLIMLVQMLMHPCGCRRCRSSSEGETYFSAIKCPADKKSGNGKRECQYLLPTPNPNHTTLHDVFVWKCACSFCPGATRQEAVEQLVLTIRQKVEAASMSPNAYEELKSVVIKNSGKTVHPNHSVMLYALLNIAAIATREIVNVEANKNPTFSFNLHNKYLADFDVVERLHQVQPGRCDQYGMILFCQTLLKMSQLAENVLAPETKPSFEDLEKNLASILGSLKESWIIINDNPLAEPFDTAREGRLRKFYATHLLTSIMKGMDQDVLEKVPSVKLLKEKYFSPTPVNLDMTEEELKYRKLIVIEDNLTDFIKKMDKQGLA